MRTELKNQGSDISKVYDPTALGKVLWAEVHYGHRSGLVSSLLYTANVNSPTFGRKEAPATILLKANKDGILNSVD